MGSSEQARSIEPTLDELLNDPVIQAVMRRDGVSRVDILGLVEWARLALDRRRRQATIAPAFPLQQ
jgi:hypothetical protein